MLPSKYLEKGWCQFTAAVDDVGVVVDVTSDRAVKWCLLGSVHAAYCSGSISEIDKDNMINKLGNILDANLIDDMFRYNDSQERTQEDVVKIMIQAERKLDLIELFW